MLCKNCNYDGKLYAHYLKYPIKCWITKEYEHIPIENLKDSHLSNILAMLERKGKIYDNGPYHFAIYSKLLEESMKRQPPKKLSWSKRQINTGD